MILGFDHIALNSDDFLTASNQMKSDGYECVFTEKKLMNSPLKRPSISVYTKEHDISFFRKNGHPNIELTDHGSISDERAPYSVSEKGIIQAEVPDINSEIDFWCNFLHFRKISPTQISFFSAVPAWSCSLRFSAAASIRNRGNLNSRGFTCIAFVVKNIDQYSDFLATSGKIEEKTNSFEMRVHKKLLKIVLFRTPAGLLCELIEFIIS